MTGLLYAMWWGVVLYLLTRPRRRPCDAPASPERRVFWEIDRSRIDPKNRRKHARRRR